MSMRRRRQSPWLRMPSFTQERGSVSVFAIIIAAVLILVAGLCIEGGRVLTARASMTDDAEQAARAGAQHLADSSVRSGGDIVLDTSEAQAAARGYLVQTDHANDSEVVVTPKTVTVTIEHNVPTSMLRLVGLDSVHVTATGQARVAVGIYGEEDL